MLTCTQGYEFRKEVSSQNCKLIATDGVNKIFVVDIVTTNDGYELYASPQVTKDWHSGRWTYQILSETGIEDQGTLKVFPNLEYSNDITISYWKKILQQVEERIAGKAIDPANDISVGDKRISYYRLDELLKLRDFILKKIAEEEAEETGEETIGPDDQKTIKYMWRAK